MKRKYINRAKICVIVFMMAFTSCEKFIDIDAPSNTVSGENAYKSDQTAIGVLTGVYTKMSLDNSSIGSFGSGLPLMSLYPSLSADELTLLSGVTSTELVSLYKNNLKANDVRATNFWNRAYQYIYTVNSAIKGLNESSDLTPASKVQLLGEAYFLRAFCYFYLINMYGDIPLILSTNYAETASQPRMPTDQVYEQIKSDLTEAQNLLSDKYLDGKLINSTEDRIRPTKHAATALLARVYLYLNDNVNAELQSTILIDNKDIYDIASINNVFLKNSRETIWALQPVGGGSDQNTGEGKLFNIPSYGPSTYANPVYMSGQLLEQFESGDKRFDNWIDSVISSGTTYYYPHKYKIGLEGTETVEYPIVLRLAEQYLIRAEARAKQNKLQDAIADLDVIRARASLPLISNTNPSVSQADLLKTILHERQVELFTEWGHRWLDLKRTNTINDVMQTASKLKGGLWDSHSALYPIPLREIQSNPGLVQNSGY
jgi:starch-binding outer membrane protein, SusD/RagB family